MLLHALGQGYRALLGHSHLKRASAGPNSFRRPAMDNLSLIIWDNGSLRNFNPQRSLAAKNRPIQMFGPDN
jgi:hypothetical protein